MTFISSHGNLSPLSVSVRSGFESGGHWGGPQEVLFPPTLYRPQGGIAGASPFSASSNPCKGPLAALAGKWGCWKLDTNERGHSMTNFWLPQPRAPEVKDAF